MRRELRHALQQGPVLRGMGRLALRALRGHHAADLGAAAPVSAPRVARVPPVSAALARDFVSWAGGDPSVYAGAVPPHLFPHWVFPVLAEALADVRAPIHRALNGGCRMEPVAPIPAGHPLRVVAGPAVVDAGERRTLIRLKSETTSEAGAPLLRAEVRMVIPRRRGRSAEAGRRRDPPRVPEGARAWARRRLSLGAGFEFACLTGDFNPLHWVWPYARLMGFRRPILHGFGTFALAVEALVGGPLGRDPMHLRAIDVRFTRPLVLPREVGVWVQAERLFVGEGPGRPAYLEGTFEESQ